MRLSQIKQIIKEEVAKAISEVDKNRELNDKFAAAVGFKPTAGGPENKMSEEFELWIPSLEAGDASEIIRSKVRLDSWMEAFRNKYGEEPKLKKVEDKQINDRHYMKVDVLNPAFNEWRKSYIAGKSGELEKYKNKD